MQQPTVVEMTTEQIFEKFGIDIKTVSKVKDVEELKKNPPAMLIATAQMDFSYSINYGGQQTFKQGTSKVLSPGLYLQLENSSKTQYAKMRPAEKLFKDVYKPYNGQDLSNKKLVVWRTGGIGDLLFIQPSLRYLKKKYPTCIIYICCAPTYHSIVATWDCIDKVLDFPLSDTYLYECDYHTTFEGVIERTEEAEKVNAYKLFSEWMGLNKISNKDLVPILKTVPIHDEIVQDYLTKNNLVENEFIVMQLRASSPIRTPGSNCWKNIMIPLLKEGYNFAITDNPLMADRIDKFISIVIPDQYKNQVYNFTSSSTNILNSISLVAKCRMTLSPDSSFIHIGQALNKPGLGIYGPFSGDVRLSTYKNAEWVEPRESNVCKYNGRRCYIHGQYCEAFKEGETAPCFNFLDYDEIFKKAQKLYALGSTTEKG